MGIAPFTSDEASKAMLDGLTSRIRAGLRERILASIEPELSAAIDAAVESLKIAIHTHRDMLHMKDVINIVINRDGK